MTSLFRPTFTSALALASALFLSPAAYSADEPAAAPEAKPEPKPFYYFVNATGKFTDEQISWSFSNKDFKTLKEAPTAPAKIGGGGRINFKFDAPAEGEIKAHVYREFIEFTHGANGTWYGNTTQVDEFVVPIFIEGTQADGKVHEAGIKKSRTAIFDEFKKNAPAEFQSCVKGSDTIVSPMRADFGKGKVNNNYFAKYVDDIWTEFAEGKTLPSGWTGKSEPSGAFTWSKPGEKDYKLSRKPTTEEIFLGTAELGKSADMCSAFNRHVFGDPGDWRDVSKYYKAYPNNFYAAFWHKQTVDGKAYGFCYDDFNQQAAYFEVHNAQKLVITLYWDKEPAKK